MMADRRFTVAAAFASALLAAPGEGAPPPPLLDQPAPAFSLRGVDGSMLSLADLRGKLVVLHFGASW